MLAISKQITKVTNLSFYKMIMTLGKLDLVGEVSSFKKEG